MTIQIEQQMHTGSNGPGYRAEMREKGLRHGKVGREPLLDREGCGHMSGPQAINIKKSYSSG